METSELTPPAAQGPGPIDLAEQMQASLERLKAEAAGRADEHEAFNEERRKERVAALRRDMDAPPLANDWLRRYQPVEPVKRPGGTPAQNWEDAWTRIAEKLDPDVPVLLALVGGSGTGKTTLAIRALRHVTEQLRTARYTTLLGFQMAMSDARIKGELRDTFAEYTSPGTLVIDEIDKVDQAAWEAKYFFGLLTNRHNHKLRTILVSNGSGAKFAADIGTSLMQRIVEQRGCIECDWAPLRPKPTEKES